MKFSGIKGINIDIKELYYRTHLLLICMFVRNEKLNIDQLGWVESNIRIEK